MKSKITRIIALLLLVLLVFVGKFILEEITLEDINISDEIVEKDNLKISVHIDGEVKSPGLYTFDVGARIDNAIKLAGGITEKGDISRINLAEELKDGQKVIIPSKGEVMSYGSATDSIKFDATAGNSSSAGTSNSKSSNDSKKITIGMLNIMNEEELQSIPGIGPVLAKSIVDYRNSNGSYGSSDDLINVKGIGEKKLAKLKAYIEWFGFSYIIAFWYGYMPYSLV